jgi:hypothetical protein
MSFCGCHGGYCDNTKKEEIRKEIGEELKQPGKYQNFIVQY